MSIGETLAAARRESGRSVADLSAVTRIRLPIIEAIERDDFSRSGGDFYARAHVRALATALGVDCGPLLAEFDAARGGPPTGPDPREVFEVKAARRRRRGPNWTAAMAVAAAVVALLALVNVLTSGDGRRATTTIAESAGSGSRPAAPARPAPAPKPGGAVALAPVSVRVQVVGQASWVGVKSASGRQVFSGTLTNGANRVFTDARELRVVLGNAGGVRLVVNGRDLGRAGRTGDVVRLTFGPGDPNSAKG